MWQRWHNAPFLIPISHPDREDFSRWQMTFLAPPILVRCDKKRGVPYVAVLSVGIVTLILCMLPFKVLIVADVFLLSASYVMVYLSAMILRKRIPREEYKFRIPGGYGFLCFICIIPITVAFISFLINGTDYFIGGIIGIMTGPVMYIIWRWRYGGLTKKNPVVFIGNMKTGLAIGDLKRMSILFGILAIIGFIGVFFLALVRSGLYFGRLLRRLV